MAKRISQAEAKTAILAAISAAGGSVSHNDLVVRLEAGNTPDAVKYLLGMAQSGQIVSEVVAQETGRPVLMYKAGGA